MPTWYNPRTWFAPPTPVNTPIFTVPSTAPPSAQPGAKIDTSKPVTVINPTPGSALGGSNSGGGSAVNIINTINHGGGGGGGNNNSTPTPDTTPTTMTTSTSTPMATTNTGFTGKVAQSFNGQPQGTNYYLNGALVPTPTPGGQPYSNDYKPVYQGGNLLGFQYGEKFIPKEAAQTKEGLYKPQNVIGTSYGTYQTTAQGERIASDIYTTASGGTFTETRTKGQEGINYDYKVVGDTNVEYTSISPYPVFETISANRQEDLTKQYPDIYNSQPNEAVGHGSNTLKNVFADLEIIGRSFNFISSSVDQVPVDLFNKQVPRTLNSSSSIKDIAVATGESVNYFLPFNIPGRAERVRSIVQYESDVPVYAKQITELKGAQEDYASGKLTYAEYQNIENAFQKSPLSYVAKGTTSYYDIAQEGYQSKVTKAGVAILVFGSQLGSFFIPGVAEAQGLSQIGSGGQTTMTEGTTKVFGADISNKVVGGAEIALGATLLFNRPIQEGISALSKYNYNFDEVYTSSPVNQQTESMTVKQLIDEGYANRVLRSSIGEINLIMPGESAGAFSGLGVSRVAGVALAGGIGYSTYVGEYQRTGDLSTSIAAGAGATLGLIFPVAAELAIAKTLEPQKVSGVSIIQENGDSYILGRYGKAEEGKYFKIPFETTVYEQIQKTGRISPAYSGYQYLLEDLNKRAGSIVDRAIEFTPLKPTNLGKTGLFNYEKTPYYGGSPYGYTIKGGTGGGGIGYDIVVGREEAIYRRNVVMESLIEQGYSTNQAEKALRFTAPKTYLDISNIRGLQLIDKNSLEPTSVTNIRGERYFEQLAYEKDIGLNVGGKIKITSPGLELPKGITAYEILNEEDIGSFVRQVKKTGAKPYSVVESKGIIIDEFNVDSYKGNPKIFNNPEMAKFIAEEQVRVNEGLSPKRWLEITTETKTKTGESVQAYSVKDLQSEFKDTKIYGKEKQMVDLISGKSYIEEEILGAKRATVNSKGKVITKGLSTEGIDINLPYDQKYSTLESVKQNSKTVFYNEEGFGEEAIISKSKGKQMYVQEKDASQIAANAGELVEGKFTRTTYESTGDTLDIVKRVTRTYENNQIINEDIKFIKAEKQLRAPSITPKTGIEITTNLKHVTVIGEDGEYPSGRYNVLKEGKNVYLSQKGKLGSPFTLLFEDEGPSMIVSKIQGGKTEVLKMYNETPKISPDDVEREMYLAQQRQKLRAEIDRGYIPTGDELLAQLKGEAYPSVKTAPTYVGGEGTEASPYGNQGNAMLEVNVHSRMVNSIPTPTLKPFTFAEKSLPSLVETAIPSYFAKSIGMTGATSITINNPILNPIIEPSMIPIVNPIINPILTPIVNPVITPIMTPIINPIISPVITPIVTPIVMPIVVPVVNPNPSPIPGNPYRERTPPLLPPGFIFGTGSNKNIKKKKLKELYEVLIKRHGKYTEVGELPIGKAYEKGQEVVERTLARTFKLVPTGKYTSAEDVDSQLNRKVFREKKHPEPLTYVQRSGIKEGGLPSGALTSFGERQEIQLSRRNAKANKGMKSNIPKGAFNT